MKLTDRQLTECLDYLRVAQGEAGSIAIDLGHFRALVDEVRAGRTAVARERDAWTEEDGFVLWWRFPIEEPPYSGNPLCDDFPEYVTHWTPIVIPVLP